MSTWCIIIPYRNREEHLARFIPHYNDIFPETPIYVIEQDDDRPFNRAKLMNVGFLEAGKNYDWAVYHDVDMYVFPDYACQYKFPEMPTHLATCCEQFHWKSPYPDYSGGVLSINTEQMKLSGGFSNNFWSRNAEDDEMRHNLNKFGFVVQHVECYYHCADHERYYDPIHFPRNLSLLKKGRNEKFDGINHCHYYISSIEKKQGYTLIKAKL